jgi:FkbM family methyltransferase
MGYLTQIFQTRSFSMAPARTLFLGAKWLLYHVMFRRSARVRLTVGDQSFSLQVPPLMRHFGSAGVFVQREYYEPLLEFAEVIVKPGFTVIDCGANQGIFTCAFAAIAGPDGLVVAVEPQSYAVELIRENIRLNGFTQCVVEASAVGSEPGEAVLDRSKGPVAASIIRDFGGADTVSVSVTTIDSIVSKHEIERVDVVKLDVEGAEHMALLGASSVISRDRPIVVAEATPSEVSWRMARRLLEEAGYQMFEISGDGALVSLHSVEHDHSGIVFMPTTP